MGKEEHPTDDASATAPGVRYLRSVWGIETDPKPREMPPRDVSSNIYAVPQDRQKVPRRRHP